MDTVAHMNTTDIGIIAKESNVKEVVSYHLYPQFPDNDLVAEIKEEYDGPVRLAENLEVIEL